MRRFSLYSSGIIILTGCRASRSLHRREACHKKGELEQVAEAAQRTPVPHDNFKIRRHDVGLLRRNSEDSAVVEAQQQPPTSPVGSHADTDGMLSGKRMEWMGNGDKLLRSKRSACNSN